MRWRVCRAYGELIKGVVVTLKDGGGSLLKTLRWFVYSMADSRKDMSHELRQLSLPLLVHLLLLVYYKEEMSYVHWRGEVFSFFPHALVRYKGQHKFPNQDFLDRHLFLWLIDEQALIKHFKHKVLKEGLLLPTEFDVSVWRSLSKIGALLHEATGILAKDHAIYPEQFYAILARHGL
jgi:hypothetical protein